MKEVAVEIAAHALEYERRFSDLLVMELADASTIHRICNYDLTLQVDVGDGWGVQDYLPIPFTRSEATSESDLTIEDVIITLPNVDLWWATGPTPIAMSLTDGALMGLLDGAELRLYIYDHEAGEAFYHSDWLVGDLPAISRLGVSAHLQSWDIRVDKDLPTCVFGGCCNNAVYDSICGLDPLDWTWAAHVDKDSDRWDMWTSLMDPDYTWDLSMVEFTTGSNAGHRRLVRKYYGPGDGYSRIIFTHALPWPPRQGDEFEITLGCNKTINMCAGRFANRDRFRGYPYIPRPEIMVG